MTKEFIALKLKQTFTIKRILISLLSLFFILFFVGGCSFRYMDWQYYKVRSLANKESGEYIFNKALYDEAEILREKNNGLYVFVKLENGMYVDDSPLLSNGGRLFVDLEEDNFEKIDKSIFSYHYVKYYYIDNNNDKHLISYQKVFRYIDKGLWLEGDEGRGIEWKNGRTVDGYLKQNKFLLKDGKWQQIEK